MSLHSVIRTLASRKCLPKAKNFAAGSSTVSPLWGSLHYAMIDDIAYRVFYRRLDGFCGLFLSGIVNRGFMLASRIAVDVNLLASEMLRSLRHRPKEFCCSLWITHSIYRTIHSNLSLCWVNSSKSVSQIFLKLFWISSNVLKTLSQTVSAETKGIRKQTVLWHITLLFSVTIFLADFYRECKNDKVYLTIRRN